MLLLFRGPARSLLLVFPDVFLALVMALVVILGESFLFLGVSLVFLGELLVFLVLAFLGRWLVLLGVSLVFLVVAFRGPCGGPLSLGL